MRYTVIRYASNHGKTGARMWYKVVDTFNGAKVMRKTIPKVETAQAYADELNVMQQRMVDRSRGV